MIVRPRTNWFKTLFVWRGSVLPSILPRLLGLLFISCVAVYFRGVFFGYRIALNIAPFTLMGIALAIFLGFRNSASYDRFWEGRKLWGALLNCTRSLSRQAITMSGFPAGSQQVKEFVYMLIAFTHALRHQLRSTDPSEDLSRLLPQQSLVPLQSATYKPIIILKDLAQWVARLVEKDQITPITQTAFDQNFNQLSDIVGGCERILGTPIPFPYTVLLHRTVYIYCLLLPFALVDLIGWMTPVIVVFIGYTFVALDAIVTEIEEPFGTEPNDLALGAMSEMIENTLREMLGEEIKPLTVPDQSFIQH